MHIAVKREEKPSRKIPANSFDEFLLFYNTFMLRLQNGPFGTQNFIMRFSFPLLFFVKETSKKNSITTVIGIKRIFIGTERYKFVMGRQMVFQL